MAKTKLTKARVGRQAPVGVWSPKELLDAVRKPSREEKVRMLREVGIIDAKGELAKKYRSWGTRVSRTEAD
jgi:hypothetical protein